MDQSQLKPVKTTKKVQSNIDKFESLALGGGSETKTKTKMNTKTRTKTTKKTEHENVDRSAKPRQDSKTIGTRKAIIEIVDDDNDDNDDDDGKSDGNKKSNEDNDNDNKSFQKIENVNPNSINSRSHHQPSLTSAIQEELKIKSTTNIDLRPSTRRVGTGTDASRDHSNLQLRDVQRKGFDHAAKRSKRDSTAFLQRAYLLPESLASHKTLSSSLSSSSLSAAAAAAVSSQSTSSSATRGTTTTAKEPTSPKTKVKPTITTGQSLVEDAQEILKSQPNAQDVAAVFEYLQFGIDNRHDFNVKIANAKSAQIINVLVTTTIPDIWTNLSRSRTEISSDEYNVRKTLLACLACPAGIGGLVAQIKILSTVQVHDDRKKSSLSTSSHLSSDLPSDLPSQSQSLRLMDLLSVLAEVLKSNKTIFHLLSDTSTLYTQEAQRWMSWQELVTLVAGGRILGTAAQALKPLTAVGGDNVHDDDDDDDDKNDNNNNDDDDDDRLRTISWLGDGNQYNKWLAKNVAYAATQLQSQPTDKQSWKFLSLMVKRGLSLGSRNVFVEGIYTSLLFGKRALWTPLHQLLTNLADYEQKVLFDTILLNVSNKSFGEAMLTGFHNDPATAKAISATAALITGLIRHNKVLEEHLQEWLVVANASYASIGLASRRALIATLATSEEKLQRVLERALANFADKLQIQHASSLQQDACAQTILLTIGYLKRANRTIFQTRPEISSLVMRSVSNRLAASVPHARFLGMVVGMAMSKAVDQPDQALKFDVEEMEDEEAQLWQGIPDLQDVVADPADLSILTLPYSSPKSHVSKQTKNQHEITKLPSPTSEISSLPVQGVIEEMESGGEEDDNDDDDDDGLVPYAKPDSDPEDSDDDPTLINRAKPSAPVYIIDLIKQLQTNDKPDVIDLALKTAPALIRRKIGFGSELSDNINALTTSLINLQDGMNEPRLEKLRLQSVIACILAQPVIVAPSLAALYFEGDFAISQRVMLLTALGLSARELAGFRDDGNESRHFIPEDVFPSKRLPPHLRPPEPQRLEAQRQDPISALTIAQAQSMIQPMALAAADKMTGPSILKIRTFSSRMEVEKKRAAKMEARTKIIPKNLHALLAKSFYLPLCSRMSLILSMSPSAVGKLNTTIVFPSLVRMLLQTLTLILHTLGPSASLNLPALTHETLLLLLSLHAATGLSTDAIVLPALLHLLLALLDVTIEIGYTAQERLIVDHGSQVAELVTWSNSLTDHVSIPEIDRGDKAGSGLPWTVLAAGIQIKWFEMGNRFQGRMLGLVEDG